MNNDIIKGKWNLLKGEIKKQWADLTDDDLLHVEGQRDKFVGLLQERYGKEKEAAEREIDEWNRRHDVW